MSTTADLHPTHPFAGMTDEELRNEIYTYSANAAQFRARAQYGDPDLAEAFTAAAEAAERLLADAVRLLGR